MTLLNEGHLLRLGSLKKRHALQRLLTFSLLFVWVGFGVCAATPSLEDSLDPVTVLQSTVTGTVTDNTGAPLPGASIVQKGTTNGTQTDFDGNYSIDVPGDAILVVSYIGFGTQEIAVGGRTSINVQLEEAASALSEVVVLGYATQTRGDVTGSVASVDIAEATKAPLVNAAEALEGRVTGVTVTNAGTPGGTPKIVIRGFGTSNNTNPLYIIDGVQTDNGNILNSINPGDIEQINVLKDGAAAIYGARASNGVVIITTKSGSYGQTEPSVSLNMYAGVSRATNLPDMLNAQQHGEYVFQALRNDGATVSHPQYGSGANPVVPTTLQGFTRIEAPGSSVRVPRSATVQQPNGTNWFEEITRDAPTQNIDLSVTNGTETGRYFLSANYLNRQGVLEFTGFKQGTTRLNSEFKIGDRITIGEHLNASFSNQNEGTTEAINMAYRSSPLIPVFDDEGDFAGTGPASTGLSNVRNAYALLARGADNYNKIFRVFGDLYLRAELYEGLSFKTTISGNIENFHQRRFQKLDPEFSEPLSTNTLFEQDINNWTWTWNNVLNYSNVFGDHTINALVGIEAVEESSKGKEIFRSGFLFETPDFYLLSNGATNPVVGFAYDGGNTLFSIFGTANYNYKGKYFATVTLRNDKSSRFLGDNQSQTFPSFSAGWLMSDEDFFPADSFISRLKLKASYGELGNQTLPASNPTLNISTLSESLGNYAIGGGSVATGAILSQVGNPNLKWETSVSTNFGFEMGMFNNDLTVSFEYFDIDTKDLITRDFSLISSTAIDAQAPLVNLGDIQNTGFDLAIGYSHETDYGLNYSINANISHYKNEVKTLGSAFQAGRTDLRMGAVTRTEVGRSISEFFGRQVTGFDSNGRFTYADVNDDGIVNDDDRTYIGSPHPDFTYGVNLAASYKGFDLSAFFSGSQGNDAFNYQKIFTDFPTFFGSNQSTRVLDAWTPENTNATVPALSQTVTNAETGSNSYYVEDASFLRLKNLQIGYTFNDDIASKVGLDMLRVYVQGTNLFTITDYNGLDPEVISFDNLSLGIDGPNPVFPVAQILSVGINTKF
ncbi:SusC/RagA family TonB-linked outer membrane protein [Lentiprolixibacter aurantiacus]|uniref:TonB-dependent receptor n=1 Tax=Lentiprolixibacter aurantiacus TaxID=2993939 RepID=A0AAE3ML99_9FLAO|nr:TonB-dependent receptor [Lentiprolixibacter aurantiacus]MCX2719905.1 TonB-dependent receptor [Lentiprolixibacter aurantiacus]